MRSKRYEAPALAGVLLAAVLIAPAAAQEESGQTFSLFIDVGGQTTDVSGQRDSKFEEYREVPNGAVLNEILLGWTPAAKPWYFDLRARDVRQDDEQYGLAFGRAGSLRVRAGWQRIPHFFSRNSTWLLSGDSGNYQFPQASREQTEANPELIRQFLAAGPAIDVRLRRDIATLGLDYELTPFWGLHVDARQEERDGNRRLGVGTYIRKQTVEPGTGAGSFDRERFEPRGIEMPEPIDYQTTDYEISTSFHRGNGFLDVGFQGSSFQNHADTLFWDNPFEAFPSVASAADRGRFARGGLDLWPDNTWQRLHASGGFSLPARTRVNATYAVATMEQDDPFLPFTQNEALFFPGPDGVLGTADDVRGTSLSLLPASNLDGKIDTTRADLRVTSHPMEPLTLQAAYRLYKYEDKSRDLVFPGYAAFGESFYRVGIGLRLNGVERLFNEPGGYERAVWSLGGSYRFGRPARLDLEYTNTQWDYDKRQVEGTTEDAIEARLQLDPVDWFTARLTWLDASRDFDGPYQIGLETSRIRAFDVWNRDRTRYGAELDFMPGEAWTLGLVYSNWQDDYPGVIPEPAPLPASNPFPSFSYGLNETSNDSLSLTATYAAARWSLTGSIGRDTSEWTSLATSKTTLANDTVQFDPANRWRRVQDDTLDWANLAFESVLIPEKLSLLADLNYSAYDGELKTTNLGTPTINSAVAYAFEPFKSDLFSGNVAVRWAVAGNADLEARYLYEPYRLDDFMWDPVQPYMQGIIEETGGSPAQIRDTDVRRFLFLDSRYSDYTANVFSLAIRLRY